MKGFSFETSGTNTYLVYEIQPEDVIDTMGLGMLTNNKILGLSTAIFMQMDQTKYIKYNVSSKISAKLFFTGAVNKKRLLGVFSGIVNAMLAAEDYMLDVNTILLDLNYIFADVSTCETSLICLPVIAKEREIDFRVFFKNIMFGTQFDQTENCDYVAKIISYLNSTTVFSLLDFKALIDDIRFEKQQEDNIQKMVQPAEQPIQQKLLIPDEQQSVQPSNNEPQQKEFKMSAAQPEKQQPCENQNVDSNEKKMGMMHLLMHYSKENAAVYKAQKAARQSKEKTKKKDKNSADAHADFAIPGQQPGQMEQQSQENYSQTLNQQMTQQPVVNPAPISNQQQFLLQQQIVEQQTAATQIFYGETSVLSEGRGETTVLSTSQTAQPKLPYLIRLRTQERVNIDKPVFRIGKEKSYVDYFINDNTAISRSHANIVMRGENYFIVDTNSTNHTYVNGQMIPSSVETKLTNGVRFRLANEDFEFYIS